jgi:Ca2+-transporting ATPase
MRNKPRPLDAPVFTTWQWVRICIQGLIMTVGVLGLYSVVEDDEGAVVAASMLIVTLSMFHIVTTICVRDELGSVFNREAIPGGRQLRLVGLALALTVLGTELGFLQRILDTTSLSIRQWIVCLAVSLSLLVVEEAIKYYLRHQSASSALNENAQPQLAARPQAS